MTQHRSWLATAVGVLLVLALVPAARAASWTAPALWSLPGEAIGPAAQVSVTPSGDALAVWTVAGAAKARWQYTDGSFSAVFDPLAGSGFVGTPTITGARAWGDRQAVLTYTGSTDDSDLPTEQATFGLRARRISDTTPAAPIVVASSTATRSVGGSTSLLVTTTGTAVVGWYDAARPATLGSTDVRYSRLRILYPADPTPGPVQEVDEQRDRTTSGGLGNLTAAGTSQPLFWLNEGGTGVVATHRLVDPDAATNPAPREYRLQPFNLSDGVNGPNAGKAFTLTAPIPDPFAVGSSAVSVGPAGAGALFWSLTADTPPGGQFGTGVATWSVANPGGPGFTAALDASNGGQQIAAARDGAGRTILAWAGRFDASPHQSLTIVRMDTGFGYLGQPEELAAPRRIAALVGTATGARLITRDLVNGNQWQLADREVPTNALTGLPRTILPAEAHLALASAPERSADGTIVLPLRRQGDDGKDVLWVTRLPGSDGPPTGGGGDGGGAAPAPGTGASAPATPASAPPSSTSTLALRRATSGVVRVSARGTAVVRLRCTAGTACAVRLTARRRRTVLATLRGTIPAGRTAALRLTLTKAGRALVRRKGSRATLRLAGTITAAGRSRATSLTLTIRRG